MRTEGSKEISPGIRTVIIGTRVHRIVSNRGKTETTIRGKGVIRLQGILANKPRGTTVVLTQHVLSVGRITQGNAVRELPHAISAVKKGITQRGAQLRLLVMIDRIRLRKCNLGQ